MMDMIAEEAEPLKKSKTTGELVRELSSVSNIREYFDRNGEELAHDKLSQRLKELADQAGINRSEVAQRAQLDRFYVYDIFSGRKLPSANKMVCLILGLGADLDTAQELLRLAGRSELYARYPRDSILIYAIQHHLTVDQTNDLLYEDNQPLLIG